MDAAYDLIRLITFIIKRKNRNKSSAINSMTIVQLSNQWEIN